MRPNNLFLLTPFLSSSIFACFPLRRENQRQGNLLRFGCWLADDWWGGVKERRKRTGQEVGQRSAHRISISFCRKHALVSLSSHLYPSACVFHQSSWNGKSWQCFNFWRSVLRTARVLCFYRAVYTFSKLVHSPLIVSSSSSKVNQTPNDEKQLVLPK